MNTITSSYPIVERAKARLAACEDPIETAIMNSLVQHHIGPENAIAWDDLANSLGFNSENANEPPPITKHKFQNTILHRWRRGGVFVAWSGNGYWFPVTKAHLPSATKPYAVRIEAEQEQIRQLEAALSDAPAE